MHIKSLLVGLKYKFLCYQNCMRYIAIVKLEYQNYVNF